MNFKFRLESVSLHEDAIGNATSEYLSPATKLKSLDQDWMMLGLGAEWRFDKKSYVFYLEAYLGYAMGSASEVFLNSTTADGGVTKIEIDTLSSFYVGGGFGFKKKYKNRFTILTNLRTFYVVGGVYAETALQNSTLIPFPLMISMGAEYQL